MRKVYSPLICGILFACAGLWGCVGNQSYRRGDVIPNQLPPAIEPLDAGDCRTLPPYECVHTPQGEEPQHFYLSHIEFDDMGEVWSIGNLHHDQGKWQSQLATALDIIDKAQDTARREERAVVVIAYVHGWHNNSSPYDEKRKDLGSFKSVLQDLSKRYSLEYPKPPVLVGIFLSWRGQVLAANHVITYWNRRDAANRIGGASLTEVVTRLMFETKGVPLIQDNCDSKTGKPDSHFVVIGHSFGARALEHAIVQPVLSLILERQAEAQSCIATWNQNHPQLPPLTDVSFVAPADLIVFLNAANDAFEMKGTIEALKRSGIRVLRTHDDAIDGAGGPFLISITSDGDWATERIMPIAQWLSMPGLAFRKYDKAACAQGQLCDHSQSFYYRHSAASITEMRSHTVVDADIGSSECREASQTNYPWPYFVATVDGVERCFRIKENLTPQAGAGTQDRTRWNDTPAFVIGVPKTLIPSHTDIFQDGTEELLIAISNHYQAFLGSAQMTTKAKTLDGH